MKMYIRFFRNKEDGVPINSLYVCPGGNDKANCLSSDADTIKTAIDEWMELFANCKVDFVWLVV